MKDGRLAPALLEALARGALRGGAPAWDTEARAGLGWTVQQVIDVVDLLKIIARCLGYKGDFRGS